MFEEIRNWLFRGWIVQYDISLQISSKDSKLSQEVDPISLLGGEY